jgi:hypothetical protein
MHKTILNLKKLKGGLYDLDNFCITIGALAAGINQRLRVWRIHPCFACDRYYCVISKDLSEAKIKSSIKQIRKRKEDYESKKHYEIRCAGSGSLPEKSA